MILLKQNPKLTGESKEWFLHIINHKLQSSDGPKRWIKHLEICNNFWLERSRGLNDKVLLEQLVNANNFQSLRKT